MLHSTEGETPKSAETTRGGFKVPKFGVETHESWTILPKKGGGGARRGEEGEGGGGELDKPW